MAKKEYHSYREFYEDCLPKDARLHKLARKLDCGAGHEIFTGLGRETIILQPGLEPYTNKNLEASIKEFYKSKSFKVSDLITDRSLKKGKEEYNFSVLVDETGARIDICDKKYKIITDLYAPTTLPKIIASAASE